VMSRPDPDRVSGARFLPDCQAFYVSFGSFYLIQPKPIIEKGNLRMSIKARINKNL